MQLGLLLYAVFLLMLDYHPRGPSPRRAAAALSAAASIGVPGGVSIGPSYLGLSLVALFLACVLGIAVFSDAAPR